MKGSLLHIRVLSLIALVLGILMATLNFYPSWSQTARTIHDFYKPFLQDVIEISKSRNKYIVTLKGCQEIAELHKRELLPFSCDFVDYLKEEEYYFVNVLNDSFLFFKKEEFIICLFFRKVLSQHYNRVEVAIPFIINFEKNHISHSITDRSINKSMQQLPHILNYIFALDPTIIEIAGGVKKKIGLINGYHNQTKHNLQIVTEKWNQEIIRTTPFNVRGHWRLQARGLNFFRKKKDLDYRSC